MLSHLWLKNRSVVSRWKIDYVKLNKHRSLARVQMSPRGCAKAAARGQGTAGSRARLLSSEVAFCCVPSTVAAMAATWLNPRLSHAGACEPEVPHNRHIEQAGTGRPRLCQPVTGSKAIPSPACKPPATQTPVPIPTPPRGDEEAVPLMQPPKALPNHRGDGRSVHGKAQACTAPLTHRPCAPPPRHLAWKSGLIWGHERNSKKGTGAKTQAITS